MLNYIGDIGYVMLYFGFLGFLISSGNLLVFALLCEFVWISFYYLIVFIGTSFDSLLLLIYSIYLLCVATGEAGVNLNILIVQFKSKGKLEEISKNDNNGKNNKKYKV